MWEEEIIKIVIDEAIYVHRKLGPGVLEKVYKTCLVYRLRKRGLYVETEKPIPVLFEDVQMDCGYSTDMVVENKVIVDTKTIVSIGDLEIAQVLTYLQFLDLRYGLILNFNVRLMKYGIKKGLARFLNAAEGSLCALCSPCIGVSRLLKQFHLCPYISK